MFTIRNSNNIIVTYTLWLFCGIFGLHHFYLKRHFHGIVWSLTLGGFFVGLLYDLFQIPNYILYANDDKKYMAQLKKWFSFKKPRVTFSRFFLSFAVSSIISLLLHTTFTFYFDSMSDYGILIIGMSSAMGLYLVGNTGIKRMSLKGCLLCSSVGMIFTAGSSTTQILLTSSVAAVIANSFFSHWKSSHEKLEFKVLLPLLVFYPVMFFCLAHTIILHTSLGNDKQLMMGDFFSLEHWSYLISKVTGFILSVFVNGPVLTILSNWISFDVGASPVKTGNTN